MYIRIIYTKQAVKNLLLTSLAQPFKFTNTETNVLLNAQIVS